MYHLNSYSDLFAILEFVCFVFFASRMPPGNTAHILELN